MKVLTSKRKGNTFSLEIEESHDRVVFNMEGAFKKAVREVRIPGFRQGKVPRHIFEKHFGRESLIQEAVISTVNEAYFSAITELKLEVVDRPKNVDIAEYSEEKPVVFKCEVDVKPEVKLGKFKGLKADREKVAVSEEQITTQLNQVLESYAEFNTSEAAAKEGDILKYNLTATIDGQPYEIWTRENGAIQIGKGYMGKDFDSQLVGLNTNDEKSFDVAYAADYENADVAGKTVRFEIKVTEIREKKLPDLTEEFVSKISDLKTGDELRARIRSNMEEQAARESDEKLRTQLMDQILEKSEIQLHNVMIDNEVEEHLKYFESNLRRSGSNLDFYLQMTRRSLDDLKADLRPSAERNIKVSLVLEAISNEEKLEVTDAEIEEEVVKLKLPKIDTLQAMRTSKYAYIEQTIIASLKDKKAYDFVVSQAKIS